MHTLYRYDMGSFLIFVDAWDQGACSGRFASPHLGESGTFQSLSGLLLRLDDCLDIDDRPQSFCTVRYFSPLTGLWNDREENVDTRPGAVASFSLQVRFRRNASWQGTLTWLDEDRTAHFRSVLELMRLLDSAIAQARLEKSDDGAWQMEG